ncbi:MAG: hypothetical protein IT452_16880 [Planctomycetia bacterium]|nr:hypothetical protein [Planctomycetia bacterium]
MTRRPNPADQSAWAASTWDGSLRDQVRRWSRLTFDEILEWQEEAAKRAQGGGRRRTARTAARGPKRS